MNPEIERVIDYLTQNAPKGCGLEGIGGRPLDCDNNPWRHPENHRPAVCFQCPANSEIWKVAKTPLPDIYMQIKRGELVEGLSLTLIHNGPASSPALPEAGQQEL